MEVLPTLRTDATAKVEVAERKQLLQPSGCFGRFAWRMKFRTMGQLKSVFSASRKHSKPELASLDSMMSLVCGLGSMSFRAYRDPRVVGFEELTMGGNRVKHLNYGVLKDAVEGVLKIHLNRANNVRDADFLSRSDPYAVFSTGWSRVASETVHDTADPVWNSTHYLLIRKPGAIKRDDTKLNIELYDSDAKWGKNAERAFRQVVVRDDFLGSASVDMAELKQPGVHERKVTLHEENDKRVEKTTVAFTTEFITFEQACEELGRQEGSDAWSETVTAGTQCRWAALSDDQTVECITYNPIAFINCPNSGTQVWIHVNMEAKALAIAFRGTEKTRVKDILTDLSFRSSRMKWDDDECTLKLSDVPKNRHIRVHTGFKKAYLSVRSTILTIVENVTHWSADWRVFVTGHSLGGALATICTFELANREDAEGNKPSFLMMNFGAPRVGNQAFKHAYSVNVTESYRVVNKLDIIHKVPMMLKHVPCEISFEEDGDIVIDAQHSLKMEKLESEHRDMLPGSRDTPPPKLTKKHASQRLSVRGHFEDYYLNVVTQAIVSLLKDQKETLQAMIGGLARDTIAGETVCEDEKKIAAVPRERDDSAAESSRGPSQEIQ